MRIGLTIMAAAMALGAMADSGSIAYTYADGNLASWGKDKKERFDVAMCINDPGLAGMKVTGIKAYISGTAGVSGCSLWLSNELKIESKYNVPDIASYDVTPVGESFDGKNYGKLQVTLSQPFTLTDKPLYIGYTVTVDDNTSVNKQPVVYSRGVENPNGMWIHTEKSVLKWLEYNTEIGGVAYIVATLEGDLASNSLGIAGYSPVYAMPGEDFEAEIQLSNLGGNSVNSFKYTYSYDNAGETFEGSYTAAVPIQPSMIGKTPVMLQFENAPEATGPHSLIVTITEVNGQKNTSLSPSMECRLNVIPFVPQHRPLIEEYTGLWCQWCTGGWLGMEMIAERYGDRQVSICYHSNSGGADPMTVTYNFPFQINYFPNATIDRIMEVDPYYGSSDTQFGIARDIDAAIAIVPVAGIEIDADIEGDKVTATSHVRFIQDLDDTNYQVGFVLTCSDLHDPEWVQENAYSGRTNDYKGTPLEQLTYMPKFIEDMHFNDVAIDVDGMMGVPQSIPEKVITNQEYNTTIVYDISRNKLVQNRNNLKVCTFLIDKSNGHVVNANWTSVPGVSAEVAPIAPEDAETVIYTLSGMRLRATSLDELPRGIYIVNGRKVVRP